MMRKTRRRKWGIAVAVLLLLGAYTASVWPRVSRYNYSEGWVGAVPTPVLVLSVRWLSDEPGSLVDRQSSPVSVPYPQRPWRERFSHALKTRLYEKDTTSRLDQWLFLRRARAESPEVLTEPTAIRGDLYRYVFGAWAREERLGFAEERWARSVYVLNLEAPAVLPQMASVHARVTVFRRLVSDRRVRVRLYERLYEVKYGMALDGTGVRLVPVDGREGERWDGTVRVADWVRWPNMMSPSPTEAVRVEGTIYEGDPYAGVWWPVAPIHQSVEVLIATETGPYNELSLSPSDAGELTTGDAAVDAWLASLHAELRWERDFVPDRQPPLGFKVRVDQDLLKPNTPKGFTFGGTGNLFIKVAGEDEPRRAGEADPAWWALRDVRDGGTSPGERTFVGRNQWVGFGRTGSRVLYDWYLGPLAISADQSIEEAWIEIRPRLDSASGGNYPMYWDPEMSRIFPGVVRLPLKWRDLRRLEKALRVVAE
ncbi:MAG: hypothetical protein ACI89L_001635 [Phycisphaerales bacterium]|jgi:hypothetical protein